MTLISRLKARRRPEESRAAAPSPLGAEDMWRTLTVATDKNTATQGKQELKETDTGCCGVDGEFFPVPADMPRSWPAARGPARLVRMRTTQEAGVSSVIDAAVVALVAAGARLVYLHGSHAAGTAHNSSDIDLAAWFDSVDAPYAHDLDLPDGVDLLVLDRAPLELAGRVALRGKLLHASDNDERIVWEAMTRKIYSDELPRIMRSHQEFLAAAAARG